MHQIPSTCFLFNLHYPPDALSYIKFLSSSLANLISKRKWPSLGMYYTTSTNCCWFRWAGCERCPPSGRWCRRGWTSSPSSGPSTRASALPTLLIMYILPALCSEKYYPSLSTVSWREKKKKIGLIHSVSKINKDYSVRYMTYSYSYSFQM